jgi:hypothetical protein
MPLYEFQPSFTVDQTDLTLTSTGSGVHFNKAVTVDLGILDRISGTVSSNAELLANNYVNSISVDILNINGSSEYTNFLTDYKSNIFTFTEYDNINVFGKYTKDFGVRFTLSESSETYTSEFYLYGNLPEFSGIQIQDSTGTTFHSSSESSKTAVNSTGQTGALTSVITFNNDIDYTAFNRVDVYSSSSSSEFASQINPNPIFSHNLTNEPTQSFDINEGSLPSNTPVYLHYVPYANLGSGAAWTVGPYTFEDNPAPTTAFLTTDQSGNFVQDIASVLAVGNSSEVLDFSSNKLVFNVYGSSEDASRNSVNSFASVILLGTKNKIFGDYDAIVGGTTNVISGDATNPSDFNFIGAGSGNDIAGSSYASTIGGYNNDIFSSDYSVLGGGYGNLIQDCTAGFIGGGFDNTISAHQSVIAGGVINLITGDGYSFIGGGEGNEIYSIFGSILGGENNIVSGNSSSVLGGFENHIYGEYSFIAGGLSSRVSGDYASAIGRRIKIQDSHNGASVFADGQNRDHFSNSEHSATLDFANGVYINTGDLRISAGDVSISGSLNATGDITMGGNVVLTGIASGDITGALGYTPVDVSDTGSFLTAHPSISAAASSDNSGRTYIQDVLLDSFGHVTGLNTSSEDADTIYTLSSFGVTATSSELNQLDGVTLGSLASLSSVNAATITDNSVGAAELNVVGNGTATQFLRSDTDGSFTWAVPTDTDTTYSVGSGISLSGTTFSVAAGGGLTQTATGLSHTDTSSQASVDNNNGTVIQDVFLDTYGHITGIGSTNLDNRYLTSLGTAILDGDFTVSGLMKRTSSGTYTSVTDNSSNWNAAYTDRNKWDGGATGLNAATGRASLGLGTAATVDSSEFATAAQGTSAETAFGWGDHASGGYAATGHTHANATSGSAGFISSADFNKLSGIAASANNYSLPSGTSSVRGGFKIGYSETGQNYPVEVSSEQMFVTVPWVDTIYTLTSGDITGALGFSPISTETDDQTLDEVLAQGNSSELGIDVGAITGSALTIDTDTLFVDSTNNRVGIGTTSPSDKLEVYANGADVALRIHEDAGTHQARLHLRRGGSDWEIINDNNLTIESEGSEKMRITTTGNVGIGTTSPNTKLEVADSIPILRITGTRNANWTVGQTMAALEYFSEDASGSSANSVRASINLVNEISVYGSATGLAFSTKGDVAGAPSERLRISSAGAIKFNNYGAGTFTGTVTQKLGVDSSGNVIEMPIGAGPVDGSGTANYLARWIDSDTLGIGAAYDNGTNVGIGTTSPSNKLTVEDTIGIKRSGVAAITTLQQNASGLTLNAPAGYHPFIIKSNGVEQVRFANTGNVGIGTDAPTEKLDVVGNITASGTVEAASYTRGGVAQQDVATTASPTFAGLNTTVSATGGINIGGGTLGGGQAALHSASSLTRQFLLNRAEIGTSATDGTYFSVGGAGEFTIHNQENSFTRFGTNSLERVRISADGNVGIGTTTPTEKLEVNGNLKISSIGTGNSASSYDLLFYGTTSTGTQTDQAAIYSTPWSTNSNAGNLIFETSNTSNALAERMRIDGAGNVGIGTAAPNYKLDIAGNVNVAGSEAYITFNAGGSHVGNIAVKDESGYKLGLQTYNSTSSTLTTKMVLDTNGNVGIGTTSPASTLDILGGDLSTQFRVSNTSANSTIKYGAIVGRHYTNAEENVAGMLITSSSSNTGGTVSIGGGISAANAVNNVVFYTAANNTTLTGTERMRISSTGAVVIGETGAAVDGGLTIESYAYGAQIQSVAGSTLQIKASSPTHYVVLGSDIGQTLLRARTANLDIDSNDIGMDFSVGIDKLFVAGASGNVGIGTTTPCAKLEVNGHFAATTKSFIIPNPKKGGRLQYGVVETDEHSVYIRGKSNQNLVELPEEWEWLVDEDSVTVQLTSIGQIQQLFVTVQNNKYIKVCGLANNGEYNYVVYGTRKDVDPLQKNLK